MIRYQNSRWCIVAYALLIGAASAEDDAPQIPDGQMAKLTVVLTDPEGNPVSGAEVYPYAMRMKEQTGHGYWNREKFGPPKTVTSNEQGEAVIEYPAYMTRGPNRLTTRLVTFLVQHTDFVRQVVHFDLGPDHANVTLKPGCEVRITAVDEQTRRPIQDFGVIMAGSHGIGLWQPTGDGGRRTRSIDDGTWQTMLVKLQDDGPILFSRVMPVRVRPNQTVILRNIWMEPGAVVRGKLSENVPRPVKGYIVATSVPSPAEDSWKLENPSLYWHEWVDVEPDGTFEFDSLPHGGKVQLIGVCEGWISSTTFPDENHFVMGQLFDVDAETVDVELEMEPTGTLEVEVVTPDGQPLADGEISSWPNQKHYKGGSTLLGQRFRSANRVESQFLPANERSELIDRDLRFPYQSPLKQGSAVLKGLPVGRSLSVYLSHDRLMLKSAEDPNGRGTVRFQLPTTEPVKLKLKTVPGDG